MILIALSGFKNSSLPIIVEIFFHMNIVNINPALIGSCGKIAEYIFSILPLDIAKNNRAIFFESFSF